MSRTSVLMAVITADPASTSELYERVGYPILAQLGLIPYQAFRDALERLAATGAIESQIGASGATMWRLTPEAEPADEPILG